MSEQEKNIKDEEDYSIVKNKSEINQSNPDSIEDELDKEDLNFDSIDFNINPFNDINDITNKQNEKENESKKNFYLSEEEGIINTNLIDNTNNFPNNKLKTPYNPQMNLIEGNYNMNQEGNNYFPKFINDISGINNNTIIFNNTNNNIYNNNNNSYNNIYPNSNIMNNNLYNMGYDFKVSPFLSNYNNIRINPNINKINNNNNQFKLAKDNQSWICSFCQNFNLSSKY